MQEIFRNIWAGLAGSRPLDLVNLVLGVAGVGLMVRRSLWAFPVGLMAVTTQGVLFWQAKFYADATVQLFFFGGLLYGWWYWLWGRGVAPELPITFLSWRSRGAVLALVAAGTAGWAMVEARYTDSPMPWRDAFIAIFSVAGQMLQSRKNLENWPVWIAVNLVAIASYWKAELAFSAFLYTIYLLLAVAGWRAWCRAMENQRSEIGEAS